MKKDQIEVSRGSGNVFRDLNMPNPDLEQLRAILAARIIKVLDEKKLTVRQAHDLTGIAAADFSRIRQAKIGRFTVDRLMSILNRLDQEVEVSVSLIDGTMSQQEVAETKRKNIIDMALTFTAMIRVFAEGSKERIATKLDKLCVNLASVESAEEYEDLHRGFCDWFVDEIKTAGKKLKNGRHKAGGPASYGHAAKILDIVMKVYVYYCEQPTAVRRLLPLMHGAVDTQIMQHLKATFRDSGIIAKTIEQIDKATYAKLQKLVAKDIDESSNQDIYPVQYDDVMFYRLNRGANGGRVNHPML